MKTRSLRRILVVALLSSVAMSRAGTETPIASLEEVKGLIEQGHFDDAEKQSRQILLKLTAAQDENSLLGAKVIDLLVEALWRGGKGADPAALDLARKAVDVKMEKLGSHDPEVAISLRHLGRIYEIRNQTSEAIETYERAIALFQEQLGPRDAEVGMTQIFLGNLYLGKGKYDSAKTLFESALAIYLKTGPEERVVSVLHNLGLLNYEMGDFDASGEFYDKALATEIRLFGPDHIKVAWTLNGMAHLAEEMGEFSEARSLFERALSIRQKSLGPDHIYVAQVMNNLGHLLHLMGDYTEAARRLETALSIERAAVGEEALDTAMTLLNMARLSCSTGDFARARDLYQESLSVREKILTEDDPVLADTLREYAAFETEREEYTEAEALYRRALDILRRTLPADDAASTTQREHALTLNGLAQLLLAKDQLHEARELFEQALMIRTRIFGPDHPTVAESLAGRALVLARSGDLEAAESASRRALGIYKRYLGSSHPLTGRAHRDLGDLLARRHDLVGALDSSLAAERIGRDHLRLVSRFLPDRQALLYASVRTSGLEVALRLAAGDLDQQSRRRVWESLIQSRAVVLDEMALQRRALAAPSGKGNVTALFEELSAASRRLANLYVRGPDQEDPDRHYRLLEKASLDKERIERVLAEKSAEFRQAQVRTETRLDQVIRALPHGSALVAYARYDTQGKPSSSRYLAFVARSRDAMIQVVPLGNAEDVDRLVTEWTAAVTHARQCVTGNGECVQATGEALRRAVWDPVAASVAGASPVFVVPEDTLNLVNFAALPDGRDSYLVERGPTFHYLSAEREILPTSARTKRGEGLLALGGPAFDVAAAAPNPAREPGASGSLVASVTRGQHSLCPFFRGVTFPPLPGSLDEVAQVSALWARAWVAKHPTGGRTEEVLPLTGAAATEEAFKAQSPGRRAIHLATHAFYLDGSCSSITEGLRGIGGLSPAGDGRPFRREGENPLLLAGLALAGANRREAALPDQEDGILTAEEIGSLDLSGVEWVVLSACHTGVGEIRTGEGVLGLRRAFQVAGARTLVMSLWPVEDEATRRWMLALYGGRFQKGLSTAEAVRQASIQMLRRLRDDRQPADPLTWAAFVASGDWR